MKWRILSGVKAVLGFQLQMCFLCGVISSNDTWWVVGCVFSSPISCLCMSSSFIKLNRTKLKTDATCRYCGTYATECCDKTKRLNNPDCGFVTARVKNYIDLSSASKYLFTCPPLHKWTQNENIWSWF